MNRLKRKELLHTCKLYGIVDTGYTAITELESAATSLCKAGIKILQFRAKNLNEDEILPHAQTLRKICTDYGCLFVVNDFPQIAAKVKADVVHIGQDDGSRENTISIVGSEMLIGRSTHSESQAKQALAEGFDYIGFGPLFPTPTKKGRPSIGLNYVKEIEFSVGKHIPVFCIGGINSQNLDEVTSTGAKRVVIVSDILTAEDIEQHARHILTKLDKSLQVQEETTH